MPFSSTTSQSRPQNVPSRLFVKQRADDDVVAPAATLLLFRQRPIQTLSRRASRFQSRPDGVLPWRSICGVTVQR
ncbi:hypothetical protein C8R44DRAFT_820433 [Mycena epipterygia]|nr:hypothetical protein C8R44DRAFT_820433 [Mycena epipterygia]